jgi:tetratricopeptide (TPR) repeat protein
MPKPPSFWHPGVRRARRERNSFPGCGLAGSAERPIAEKQAPYSTSGVLCNLSHLFFLRREYGRATEEAQHALSLQPQYLPAFAILAMIAVFEGRFQELFSLGGVMEPAAGDNPVLLAGMGWGLAMAGQTEPARQILASLKIPGRFGRTPSLSIAWVHQGLGEPDQALEWLERAVEERDPKIVFLRTKPFWDSLRPTARFTDLLRRMRLV